MCAAVRYDNRSPQADAVGRKLHKTEKRHIGTPTGKNSTPKYPITSNRPPPRTQYFSASRAQVAGGTLNDAFTAPAFEAMPAGERGAHAGYPHPRVPAPPTPYRISVSSEFSSASLA